MALNSSQAVFSVSSRALRCRCSATPALLRPVQATSRQLSSTPSRRLETSTEAPESEKAARPRWSYTPERMKGPGFSINVVKDPRRTIWKVNDSPDKLDAFYIRFLGPGGDRVLSDELKWLAVTHKSFDQGRRGYNTRLAFFGRQIVALETTKAIMISNIPRKEFVEPYDRTPFSHPALEQVDKLSSVQPQEVVDKDKLARVAIDTGMHEILRWKPRLPENLEGSGQVAVLTTTVYAIIGAIALQHGSKVAEQMVRTRILSKLGV